MAGAVGSDAFADAALSGLVAAGVDVALGASAWTRRPASR